MKFIKQSSIDNLIDEARIDVVIGPLKLKKRKVFTISASLSFTGEKELLLCVHVVKNFYDSAGLVGTPCSSS
jgi:hypothetical protein